MAESSGGLLENLAGIVKDRFTQSKPEIGPKVPEWSGFIEVGEEKTKTYIEIHGEGFKVVEEEVEGKKSFRLEIEEGKPPPIFINVGGADYYRYRPFDKALVKDENQGKNGFIIVGWDPPGQLGRSENFKDKPHIMEEYAKFQYDLICSLMGGEQKVKDQKIKINIVAMSMAGVPTLIMAGQHPEVVNNLVLADTFATMKDRDFVRVIRDIIIDGRRKGMSSQEVLDQCILGPIRQLHFSDQEIRELRERFKNPIWWKDHAVSLLQSFTDLIFRADATEFCKDITAPVLLIAGTKDQFAPAEEMEKLQKLLVKAERKDLLKVPTTHSEVLGNANTYNTTSIAAILMHFRRNWIEPLSVEESSDLEQQQNALANQRTAGNGSTS